MAPALLLAGTVLTYPIAWEVWVSFTNLAGRVEGRDFVGLANYRTMLAEPFFWRALATTVVYFAVTTVAKLALGVWMAVLLARPSRVRPFVFLAVFLPWAYPGGVTVVAWYWMLNPPLTTSFSTLAGNVKYALDGAPGAAHLARALGVLHPPAVLLAEAVGDVREVHQVPVVLAGEDLAHEVDEVVAGARRKLGRVARGQLEVRDVVDAHAYAVLVTPFLRELVEPGIVGGDEVAPLQHAQARTPDLRGGLARIEHGEE